MEKCDRPRYSRLTDIVDLAVFMQSKPLGITINDIMKRYSVSRRTAERMRDSLLGVFPQIDEIETNDHLKHWGFLNFSISHLISFTSKEIGNIEQLQRRTTNREMKRELQHTIEKLKTFCRKNINAIDTNIELYLQTEGYAVRQTPQYSIDASVLDVIRQSFQTSTEVRGKYHDKIRLLQPLGLIYGEKIYLVAREQSKGDGIYNYLLHKFSDMENTEQTFNKGDFNLQEYKNRSFGVYQGEIMHVELWFSKDVAGDAQKYNFHPTQKIVKNTDNTVSVEFDAGGELEIIRHIFKWGDKCKIIKPQSLATTYKNYLQKVIDNYL